MKNTDGVKSLLSSYCYSCLDQAVNDANTPAEMQQFLLAPRLKRESIART